MSYGLVVYTNDGHKKFDSSVEAETAPKVLYSEELLGFRYGDAGRRYLDLGVSWERADFAFVNHANPTFKGFYDYYHPMTGSVVPSICLKKVPEDSSGNILAVDLILRGHEGSGNATADDTVDLLLCVLGY